MSGKGAPAQQRNRRIFAAASLGVFQRLVQVASTLVIMPLTLRALGPASFGIWGAAASLAWMSGVVDLGTSSALVTLIAQARARNQEERARNDVMGALAIGSCVSCLMLALGLGAWLWQGGKGGFGPYLIAFSGLALNVPLSSANSIWMALQKGYISAGWELVQTVLYTGGLLCAIAFTHDVQLYVMVVYAALVLSNFGSLMHLFWLHPELRPHGFPKSFASIQEVAGSGILFFILNLTAGLSFMLDNVLALQLLGPEASARMTIAMRICISSLGVLAVLSQPLWPAFVDASHTADRQWIRRTLLRGSALLAGVTLAGAIVLILFGEPLLRIWLHTDLGMGQPLLWAIAVWILGEALTRIPNLLLNALALIRFEIVVTAIATLVAWGLKFTLAPMLGVSGILWGTSITVFVIAIPAWLWRIHKWAGQPAGNKPVPAEFGTDAPLDSTVY